jgi:hypothetical protein
MTDATESNPPGYQVFVMRIWREKTTPQVWRFSLEDPTTGNRRKFTNLSEMAVYLETITAPGFTDREPISRGGLGEYTDE